MEYKSMDASQEKAAMVEGQPNPPPYQEGPSGIAQSGQQFAAGYPQQPYPGQPYPGQPYPGQPYPGQPYPGQPYQGQPSPGQPYPGQPYPGQPSGQPYPGQPYPGQVYPGQTVVTVQAQTPLSPPEKDYLGYSIFTLLCCCMPLGIGALVYSILTREANHSGHRAEAERSSRCARILSHTALGLGLLCYVILIICMFL
ncbi:hypothetical protein WMY93_026747 [Mugilogobius chulae]|uniref:Proline-rich transmembrane protein 1 n=1 Tax=Mugilogobius chulae TaxID=88201 RepID=A0AAW0N8P9_9GOBI